ncbi:hypothetical protein VTN96DRAFT_5866 [Rasamsonia emersonii]
MRETDHSRCLTLHRSNLQRDQPATSSIQLLLTCRIGLGRYPTSLSQSLQRTEFSAVAIARVAILKDIIITGRVLAVLPLRSSAEL